MTSWSFAPIADVASALAFCLSVVFCAVWCVHAVWEAFRDE
jgi:hypothetical protein